VIRLVDADDPALAPSGDVAAAMAALAARSFDDPGAEAARRRIVELVGERPDGADRTTRPGHLTGSAFVVDADGGRFVLLHHAKLRRWLQPGGHADGEANLAAVALREATEETGVAGLRVDPVPLDADVHEVRPPGEDPHLHLDVRYLVVAPPGAELAGNHESTDLRWVRWDELDRYAPDDGLRRLAAAARDRLGSAEGPSSR
jgi:8-oxo-dGTP pyrophosphatase MutT (NUDIX family)